MNGERERRMDGWLWRWNKAQWTMKGREVSERERRRMCIIKKLWCMKPWGGNEGGNTWFSDSFFDILQVFYCLRTFFLLLSSTFFFRTCNCYCQFFISFFSVSICYIYFDACVKRIKSSVKIFFHGEVVSGLLMKHENWQKTRKNSFGCEIIFVWCWALSVAI